LAITQAKKTIGYQKKKQAKIPWVTQEMLNKRDERRRFKLLKQNWKRKNAGVFIMKYERKLRKQRTFCGKSNAVN